MNFIDKSNPEKLQKIETPLIENWDEKEEEVPEGEEPLKAKDKKSKKDGKGKKGKGKLKGKDAGESTEPSGPVTVVFEEELGPFRISD